MSLLTGRIPGRQHGREIGSVGVRVGGCCVLDMLENDVQEAGHEGVHEGAGQRLQQRVSVVRVCRAIERPGQAGPYAVGDGGGQVEAGRAGGFGNVDLLAVGNRLLTGIGVDVVRLAGRWLRRRTWQPGTHLAFALGDPARAGERELGLCTQVLQRQPAGWPARVQLANRASWCLLIFCFLAMVCW